MKIKLTILTATAIAVASSVLFCINGQEIKNLLLHPGYGSCGKCNKTWDVVRGHSTPYGDAVWMQTWTSNGLFTVAGSPGDGKPHRVVVTNGMSCFPLCEQCWKDLKTPEARLPYYRKLVDSWKRWDSTAESKWPGMKASVLDGK